MLQVKERRRHELRVTSCRRPPSVARRAFFKNGDALLTQRIEQRYLRPGGTCSEYQARDGGTVGACHGEPSYLGELRHLRGQESDRRRKRVSGRVWRRALQPLAGDRAC